MVATELAEALRRMERTLLEVVIGRRYPTTAIQGKPVLERATDTDPKIGTTGSGYGPLTKETKGNTRKMPEINPQNDGVVVEKVSQQGILKAEPIGGSHARGQHPQTSRDMSSEAGEKVASGTTKPANKASRWAGLPLVRLILNRVLNIFRR